jgi:hypothetical protein
MAITIMAEIWEHSPTKDTELLLLLALADHADRVTGVCWPSVSRLARLIRKSERNTRYLLRKLEAGGHIAITIKGAQHKTNLYRILCPWRMGQQLLQENTCAAAPPCPSDGARALAPDPSSEPSDLSPEVSATRLKWLGLTPGSEAWALSLNGHHKEEHHA